MVPNASAIWERVDLATVGGTRGNERVMNVSAVNLVVLIPSYDVDGSLVPTLQSVHEAVNGYPWKSLTIVVSDSSTRNSVLSEARNWAERLRCRLVIDHVDNRRIKKAALNSAFELTEIQNADLVVICDDDVRLERFCVIELVSALLQNPEAVVAIGVARADPLLKSSKRGAGAWDLDVNAAIASRLPRTFIRTEGAILAMRGSFASTFRYPIGSGSICEDQALADFIFDRGLCALNVFEAVAFKVPPLGFKEFANQSRRTREALKTPTTPRAGLPNRARSAIASTLKSPVGAFWYFAYFVGLVLGLGKPDGKIDEFWSRSKSAGRSLSSPSK